MNNNQNQMAHITQIIAQEILQQLKQALQQTGLTHKQNQNKITYKDKNQQNAQITLAYLNTQHSIIQLQKHQNHSRKQPTTITTDIIIDEHEQTIYICTYHTKATTTYELTDPNSIQNAIETITQNL